jgi:hypothetical protein
MSPEPPGISSLQYVGRRGARKGTAWIVLPYCQSEPGATEVALNLVQSKVSAALLPSYRNETGNLRPRGWNRITSGGPRGWATHQRGVAVGSFFYAPGPCSKRFDFTAGRWRATRSHRGGQPHARAGRIHQAVYACWRHSVARGDGRLLSPAGAGLCADGVANALQLCAWAGSPHVCGVGDYGGAVLLSERELVLAGAEEVATATLLHDIAAAAPRQHPDHYGEQHHSYKKGAEAFAPAVRETKANQHFGGGIHKRRHRCPRMAAID